MSAAARVTEMLQFEHPRVMKASRYEGMARVLVVDADPNVRASVTNALSGAGHDVESASSTAAGVALARASRPEIVVFDLFDGSGLDLVRAIKNESNGASPLLVVLTSATSEEQRVAAFEAGVDDYVIKPHSMRELLLRVRALARRGSAAPKAASIELARLRIDVAARQTWVDDQRIELTRRELDVLVHLATRPGRVQTREVLIAAVWGDVEHSARVVDTTVKRVRRKIAAAGCAIKTVRGVGYKLVVEA